MMTVQNADSVTGLTSGSVGPQARQDLRLLEEPGVVVKLIDMADADVEKPAFDSWQWRAGNAIVALLARAGIGPIHLLTTRDRRTGEPHTIPVVPVEHGGRRWLVAPYGAVGWVRNAREDGRVRLRHGRATREYTIREVGADEAGPVLKRYVAVASTQCSARWSSVSGRRGTWRATAARSSTISPASNRVLAASGTSSRWRRTTTT
jgi:deazaflavin-dependent oxidoreductase (nitroreductase family)